MSRKTIILPKGHQNGKRARAGSPWIFSNEIRMDDAAKAIAPGAIVNVRGDDGQAFGTGYFNPKSLIAVRLLSGECDAVIDADFFAARLGRALALRERFHARPFYRLCHAEGDGLPGLVIDRFDDTLSVQSGTAGMERQTDAIMSALDRLIGPRTVILRGDAPTRALEGLETQVRVVKGEGRRIQLEENGARYFADLAEGQKTGWYYDQRDNRAFIASLARGKSVLDAFSYAGGFGILAAKAGAREVICLDSSAPALALAEESARANAVTVKAVKADVFEELERLSASGETFDIVVADPPPFVKSKKDLEAGARAYRKLARMAARVTAEGGILLLASCSHNISADRFALECAAGLLRTGRRAALIRQAGAGPDHPVHPMLPESAYLKALVYALD
ncbi:MAG: SAM-dependent methyltransferase [Alphaproteobacteria bacterium 64-11]|nr:class I SAM-dependent rRNA methyltransferase [Alphaproteobacteria bacterium]OJU07895.1 MAG: SAM-dependent methyltransferase [Alphaproteobacteria bacterium 64-11]